MYSMRSFLFSLRVADNGRNSLCSFLVRRFGEIVLSGSLSLRGALGMSGDVVSPCCVLCRGSLVYWLSLLATSLPVSRVFGVE